MPLPFILLGVAVAAGAVGSKKAADGVGDTRQSHKLKQEAEETYGRASAELDDTRRSTCEALESLGRCRVQLWDEQIYRFVELFEQLKNVELAEHSVIDPTLPPFSPAELLQMRGTALKFSEVGRGGAAALGTGALAGVAAYGGASAFAAASTGTAISALSGAAATNATLAWFGGGSLAAGGMGMAGGMMALGGIVAGPVLAVGGFMFSTKARENLANARSNLAEAKRAAAEMRIARALVEGIGQAARGFQYALSAFAERTWPRLDRLAAIVDSGIDYSRFIEADKRAVHLAVEFTQVMRMLLETPLLTPDGALAPESGRALSEMRGFLALRDG